MKVVKDTSLIFIPSYFFITILKPVCEYAKDVNAVCKGKPLI